MNSDLLRNRQARDFPSKFTVLNMSHNPRAGCVVFDREELAAATNRFDDTPVKLGGCKLGEGGFGPVYKGKLKFTEVAIKLLRDLPKVGSLIATVPVCIIS